MGLLNIFEKTELGTVLVGAVVLVIVGLLILSLVRGKIKNKKDGKCGCSCGCSGCPMKGSCGGDTDEKN